MNKPKIINRNKATFNTLEILLDLQKLKTIFGVPTFNRYYQKNNKKPSEDTITFRLDHRENKHLARLSIRTIGEEGERELLYKWGYEEGEKPLEERCAIHKKASRGMGDFDIIDICSVLKQKKEKFGGCPRANPLISIEEKLILSIDYTPAGKPRAEVTHLKRAIPELAIELIYRWGYGEATETKWEEAK